MCCFACRGVICGSGGILWSALLRGIARRSCPGATSNREKVVRSVVDHARDGDVILLHDMSDSSVDAALEIIDRLEAAGYQFVTVSELARLRGKTMEAGCLYTNFRPAFEVDAN